MPGGSMSKPDGRRSNKHASYYASLPPKVAKRKDRNVQKSSHGKFNTVAELEQHRIKQPKKAPAPRYFE